MSYKMQVKPIHLRFWLQTAYELGVKDHPQKVMETFNINYKKSVPQSIADQWWFIDCNNVPDELPKYLEVININPEDFPELK